MERLNEVAFDCFSMPVNTHFPPLTVENYRLLPETGPRYQSIQGDLCMAPAPNRFHQEISRDLQFELHSYLKRNPIGKLFNAPLPLGDPLASSDWNLGGIFVESVVEIIRPA